MKWSRYFYSCLCVGFVGWASSVITRLQLEESHLYAEKESRHGLFPHGAAAQPPQAQSHQPVSGGVLRPLAGEGWLEPDKVGGRSHGNATSHSRVWTSWNAWLVMFAYMRTCARIILFSLSLNVTHMRCFRIPAQVCRKVYVSNLVDFKFTPVLCPIMLRAQ